MENISPIIAFIAGLLSFLSPCVLPLVPVYLGSLAGPEVFTAGSKTRLPLFLHSLSFVIGFSLVFIIMGAGAGLAGFAIGSHLALIRQIGGGLLIFFGLFLLASLKVSWLNYEKRLAVSRSITTGYLRSLLIGAIFSLAWTPCVGPILGGILALAWSSETAWHGAYLLALYSLGLGIPFLIIGAAFDSITPLLKRIYRYSRAIYIFSGVLLIAVGILILTDRLGWLVSI
ncbi:MAG: cytochrome C biogenesis protein CcsB [Chloroflexi bacterium CG_4_8_14_3_um_filter_45_15]|nr:MAG: cytochrome C biogenesis protein CcsB [Chloroflexi bacterium CG_4_8_14_3_um_filter_45_15]